MVTQPPTTAKCVSSHTGRQLPDATTVTG